MHWWENEFVRLGPKGLLVAGVPAADLAAKHGTPLYVYGRDRILDRYGTLERALAGIAPLRGRISYAVKANPNPEILSLLEKRGSGIDAVSPNEVDAARTAGFPAERIMFTGTSVGPEDLKRVFPLRGLTINIDAAEQLEIMGGMRKREFPDGEIRVSVRWNPGVGSGSNAKVITAGRRSSDGTPIKFGVEDKKTVAVFERARELGFHPVGLHQHLGSGWVREDLPAVRRAVDLIVAKAAELERRGFRLEFLDFGGGFGPRYAREQSVFPVRDYIAHIGRAIRKAGLSVPAVTIEPGKFMVGDAGVLLLRVEYVKENYGNLFACMNGGTFNTVPRPAIYQKAHHEIVNASRAAGGRKVRVTVAGNLCETGDVFGKDRLMVRPERGDVLAVLCAGAYCRSMASTFNLRTIPPEVLI